MKQLLHKCREKVDRRKVFYKNNFSSDTGSGTLLTLFAAWIIIMSTGVVLVLAQASIAREHAASAADLAALAGANEMMFGGPDPCAQARTIAASNSARLIDCQTQGADLVVNVEVDSPPLVTMLARWVGQPVPRITESAQAGPP